MLATGDQPVDNGGERNPEPAQRAIHVTNPAAALFSRQRNGFMRPV